MHHAGPSGGLLGTVSSFFSGSFLPIFSLLSFGTSIVQMSPTGQALQFSRFSSLSFCSNQVFSILPSHFSGKILEFKLYIDIFNSIFG